MKPKVNILIGISGSGKSTLIGNELGAATVCSADHHFLGDDGVYRFNPAELGTAHAKCFRKAVETVRDGGEVVIDNTNTTTTEIAPYIALANAYGAELRIIVIRCEAETAARRNTHGVPRGAVTAMAGRLESTMAHWPSFWPEPEIRDAVL